MTVFSDTFDRADGALGANWTTTTGTPLIVSNAAQATTGASATCNVVSDTNRSEAWGHFLVAAYYNDRQRIAVRVGLADSNGYYAWVSYSAPNYYFNLGYGGPVCPANLGSVSLGTVNPAYFLIRVIWDLGNITATFNDSVTLTAYDSTYSGNLYCGFAIYSAYNRLLDFGAIGGSAITLTADPAVVGNYGQCTDIDLTGVNTSWTSGTPGAPIFTVDHGTISAQTVVDATHATITYCPGDFLGSATITDPSSGQTVGIVVTSDPGTVPPPGAGDTWSPYKTLVDATGTLFQPDWLLTDRSPIIEESESVPGRLDIIHAIRQIWNAHFGEWTGVDPPMAENFLGYLMQWLAGTEAAPVGPFLPSVSLPVSHKLDLIRSYFLNTEGTDYLTIQMILDAVGAGEDSLADVRADIGIKDNGTWISLVHLLNAIWGPGADTITTLGVELDELRGLPRWTLQSVLDAINGLSVDVDLSPVLAAIAALRGDNSTSVAGVYALLQLVNTAAQATKVSVQELRTGHGYTVQDILDAIAAIPPPEPLDLSTLRIPPVWPGEAHVTYGGTSDLATVTNVDGPMHGVLVDITATEPGTSFMQYDGVKAWRHVGGIVFYNDAGYCETYQALGFGKAMYVPKTMAIAQGAKLFKSHLPKGTIKPWTITAE